MTHLTPTRVDVTGEAAALVRRLTGIHGPLMFHQSGGCCDGSLIRSRMLTEPELAVLEP